MGEVRAAVGGGVESAAEAATVAALSASRNAALAPTIFERDSAGHFGYEFEAQAALQNQLAADEWKRLNPGANSDWPFRSARASENERDHDSRAKEHWALVPEGAGGTLSHAQAAELDLGTRVEQLAYPSISRKAAQQLARDNLRNNPSYYSALFEAFSLTAAEQQDHPWIKAKAGQLAGQAMRAIEAELREHPPEGVQPEAVGGLFGRFGSQLENTLADLVLSSSGTRKPPVIVSRRTYPDGRWIAEPGEHVYTQVRGFGGTPASLHGQIEQGKNGLLVRVLGASSVFPSSISKKRIPYDSQWTVVGDPRPQQVKAEQLISLRRKEEAAQREEAAYQAEGRSKAAQAVAQGEALLTKDSPLQRAVTEHLTGERGKLIGYSNSYAEVRWQDNRNTVVKVPSDTITVSNDELAEEWEVLLRATHDDPDQKVLDEWAKVANLADAQQRVLAFIRTQGIAEKHWHGGVVIRDGTTYAEISHSGTIWRDGYDIDVSGNRRAQTRLYPNLKRFHPHKKGGTV